MKKFLISAMALATFGMAFTSCSSDEPMCGGDGSGKITFTAQLPAELGSRAFSDGTSAKSLSYYVYKHGEKEALITGTTPINLTTSVSLDLVNGETYDVVFLAQSSNAPEGLYSYTPDTQNFTVNYTKAAQNNDNCDAFYAVKTVTVAGGTTEPVDLYRPFAQVNFGTNDATKPAVTAAYGEDLSGLTTTLSYKAKMPNVLNLVSGELSGSATVSFAASGVPAQTAFPAGNNPMDGYRYLSMNYVLAPANQNSVNNLTFQVMKGEQVMNTISVPNAPMRANYQTNIYGSLLTSTTDFTVTIQPAFLTPSLSVAEWDGKTVTYPTVDEATKSVAIQTPSDLAGLAHMVSGTDGQTAKDFAGYTVKLNGDFDFKGYEFPMIAAGATRNNGDSEGVAFSGVLDGQGHTIKNLTISKPSAADDDAVGFIANLKGSGAALKNLNIENLNISTSAEQAGLVGLVSEGASVSGVNVKSGNLTGGKATGAIVGRVMKDGTISNCTNGANVTSKTSNAGGIAGASYYTAEGKQTVITGCTNSGTIYAGNVAAGGISGLNTGLVENCTNNGNVTAVTNSAGGIVGVQQSAGYVRGCNNSGNVTCNGALGAGGIVGWVKYDNNDIAYPVQNIIEVTGNTNSGTITGTGSSTQSVSGIVGLWYQAGVCDNNINLAPAINATGMCAGITVSQTVGTNPDKVPGYQLMLYVRNNVSTTPLDKMTGSLKDRFVYINTPSAVTASGNKETQE